MPWYRTGTVSVTNNSTTVTGTDTDFSANSRVGDAFRGPDGRWYEVTNIATTTVISILPAYQGTTASGGVYGLAPMQGYVKQSADQLRAITNQYGTTLGILGTPSNATQLRTNILAAKSGANSDITSITGLTTALAISQGGTGATSQATARTALGLGSAAVAPILGTVSQSGGVPTGAIFEQGSNANGEYIKFADGTLECWGTAVQPANSNGAAVTFTFPSTFVRTVPVVTAAGRGFASSSNTASYLTEVNAGSLATVPVKCLIHTPTTILVPATDITIAVHAIGRWF